MTQMTQTPIQMVQPSKEQLLADILHLATQTHYNTNRCVFVQFSGHVDLLSISIRKNKDEYGTEIASSDIYLAKKNAKTDEERTAFERELLTRLIETKAALETFIQDGVVDEHNLKKTVTYSF